MTGAKIDERMKMSKLDIPPLNYKVIGERIWQRRREKGWSQEILAELADLTPSHISYVESGKKKVGLEGLYRIAEALGVTLDILVYEWTENPDASQKAFDALLKGCTADEQRFLYECAKAIREVLRNHRDAA